MASRFITLAFLHVESEGEPLMNKMTAAISKHKVCHVELGFDHNYYFSILHNGTASLRKKTLNNPLYEIITLQVSKQQYDICWNICIQYSKQNIHFDNVSLYCMLCLKCLPFTSHVVNLHNKTFCSKIITQALQQAEIREVMHLDPNVTTPSDLLEAVKGSFNNVIATPRHFRLIMPP